MITNEDRASIISETIERVFKMLPEVIGSLMQTHATMARLNQEFYKDHPDFASYKGLVGQVISKIEENDPLKPYSDIIKKAVPEIESKIRVIQNENMTTPALGNLSLKFESSNGNL
jgi:hypothetical protein